MTDNLTTPMLPVGIRAIRTPRAAALAGIAFSVLFAASLVLTRWAIPPDSTGPASWVDDSAKRAAITWGLDLLPFAGIAFLWFIGVLRDRIGQGEDRFFASVFLGSGLLFVAMCFVSGGVAGALVDTAANERASGQLGPTWSFGRLMTLNLATVYGMRMAAVFTISTTTIAARLGLVPRWLGAVGYLTAVVLLFGAGLVPWVELVFPAWVFVLSVHILATEFRRRHDESPSPGVVVA